MRARFRLRWNWKRALFVLLLCVVVWWRNPSALAVAKMAARHHFDSARSQQIMVLSCAGPRQNLSTRPIPHYSTVWRRIAHVYRLFFPVRYDGVVENVVGPLVCIVSYWFSERSGNKMYVWRPVGRFLCPRLLYLEHSVARSLRSGY